MRFLRRQPFLIFLLQLLWLLLLPRATSTTLDPSALQLCNGTDIPYPFGVFNITRSLPGFSVNCDSNNGSYSASAPMLPLPNNISLQVSKIDITAGYVRAFMPALARLCPSPSKFSVSLEGTPFTFSETANKLTVIGCDALALLNGSRADQNLSGCASFCYSVTNAIDGQCFGLGCCQASVPRGLKSFNLDFASIRNLSGAFTVNNQSYSCAKFRQQQQQKNHAGGRTIAVEPNMTGACYTGCSKVFILADDEFKFSTRDLWKAQRKELREVVLEWSIGNLTCDEAKKKSSLVCTKNSDCYDSPTGVGYRCNCNHGYSGNPYGPDGCKDIDECKIEPSPCVWKCENLPGQFKCHCRLGRTGDGVRNGSGCGRIQPLDVALGVSLLLLFVLLLGLLWAYFELKRIKAKKMKEKFFMQNGGLLLQQHISSHQATARIFSLEELELATDGFREDSIIGRGGCGTVYRGIWRDRVVAIKRARAFERNQIEQFINEISILSQVNHMNVVKLLGCCLESQVPILVYEFISNGTLFHHLHEKESQLSWKKRLQIAAETAAAVAYLHKSALIPIIHRDIKSTNILLDENYTAKVSDFGVSRLVPYDQTHVTTLVHGTLGYLDPEYFYSSMLTEKSDVYSFGVVLAEMLLREMPVSLSRSEEERNLAFYFVRLVEGNRLLDMLDEETVEEAGVRHLFAVADLVRRCLSLKGQQRPSMGDVAIELSALRKLAVNELVEVGQFKEQKLLRSPVAANHGNVDINCDPECYLLSQ